MLSRVVPIAEVVVENDYTKTFVLRDAAPAAPGQFLMLWIPGLDEKPFAIVAPDPLTVTVAAVGPFSKALHALRPGDRVGWRGPFGHGFDLKGISSALLIGGGYGIAALYYAATELLKCGSRVTVGMGGQSEADLLYEQRLIDLGVDLMIATEDGSRGTRGFVTEAVAQILSDTKQILACGPEAMLVVISKLALAKGIPAQLSVERYVKCGFGICGQCTLSGRLVCVDGPVFTAAQLSQLPEFGRVHRDASGALHFFQGRGARRA